MPRATPKRVRQNLKPDAVHPIDQIQNRYEAAGQGRRLAGWRTPTSGPNLALQGLQTVRDRSRDIDRNEWAGRSITRNWITTLVGIGIRSRFDKIVDEKRRMQIAELFETFMTECDADGVSHLFAMQTLACRSWFVGGECFIRERPRDLSLPLLIPVQLQLLEAEMLPLLDNDVWPGMPQGNRLRSGIELNKYDRRIAYWFYKSRPNDGTFGMPGYTDLVRVPAEEVWHIYEPERPGQMRGVSNAASVITRLRMSGDFEDAVLDRQRLANLFTLFITKQLPMEAWNGEALDAATGLPKSWIGGKDSSISLEPGMSVELRPGEDIKFANPPEAGTTFSEYMRSTHMGTAAGGGLPYELMSGDIKDIGDRTLRVVMNQFYRLAEQRQWQILIPKMCQRVVDAFAKYGALKGLLRVSEVALVKLCTHAPHAWAYIHPVQDVQAAAALVDAGFTARSEIIQQRGDDPSDIDRKRSEDRKREDSLGLNEPTAAEKAALQSKQQGQKTTATKAERADLIEARRHVETLAQIEAFATAANRPQEPIQVNVAAPILNVTPPNVTVNVEPGAAPKVQIDNHAPTQEPPVVNVSPAAVQIDNHVAVPEVHVAAPNVQIENKVESAPVEVILPERKTTMNVLRDEAGNIKGTTTIEKTVGKT